MLNWVTANLSTIIVSAILLAIIIAIHLSYPAEKEGKKLLWL